MFLVQIMILTWSLNSWLCRCQKLNSLRKVWSVIPAFICGGGRKGSTKCKAARKGLLESATFISSTVIVIDFRSQGESRESTTSWGSCPLTLGSAGTWERCCLQVIWDWALRWRKKIVEENTLFNNKCGEKIGFCIAVDITNLLSQQNMWK